MTQEAMKLALEALISITDVIYVNSEQEADAVYKANDAITIIKEALAQTQEPVGQLLEDAFGFGRGQIMWFNKPKYESMLYTTPPQRTWVGLTDKAITRVIDRMPKKMKGFMVDWDLYIFARAIEAAHGIKENT